MHFTYSRPKKKTADLQQGDILRRSPQLEAIIGDVHSYYLKPDYTHFMVLTQSCDLVRRDGKCGAPYIAIGAIRPVSLVIQRELEKYKTNDVLRKADAISDKNRDHAKRFLSTLLNNNNHEYFYLHEQVPGDLTDSSCVFLRLAISLRAEHYDKIRRARILALSEMFQAKLGWLVGNIYSRVGTADWWPDHVNEDEWNSLINRLMIENVVVLNDKKVSHVRKNTAPEVVAAWSKSDAISAVNSSPELKTRDEIVEIVTEELSSAGLLPSVAVAKARAHLINSPRLKMRLQG